MPIPAMVIETPGLPALPYGLLDTAVGPLEMPPHMRTSGALFEQQICGEAHLYPAACDPTPPYPEITYDTADSLGRVYPFAVYASETCGVINGLTRAEERVLNRLRMGEGRAVESAFWGAGGGGPLDGILQLINATSPITILGVGAQDPDDAISLLEQQMAQTYGGVAMIHARPRMAAYLSQRSLLDPTKRGPWYTVYGSEVVFGAGYAGTAPDGTAPDATSEWMYATGRVTIYRAEPSVPPPAQLIDRTTNEFGLHAIREYGIGLECEIFAVQVNRT